MNKVKHFATNSNSEQISIGSPVSHTAAFNLQNKLQHRTSPQNLQEGQNFAQAIIQRLLRVHPNLSCQLVRVLDDPGNTDGSLENIAEKQSKTL
jgi:type II secretory pathway component PulF